MNLHYGKFFLELRIQVCEATDILINLLKYTVISAFI